MPLKANSTQFFFPACCYWFTEIKVIINQSIEKEKNLFLYYFSIFLAHWRISLSSCVRSNNNNWMNIPVNSMKLLENGCRRLSPSSIDAFNHTQREKKRTRKERKWKKLFAVNKEKLSSTTSGWNETNFYDQLIALCVHVIYDSKRTAVRTLDVLLIGKQLKMLESSLD